MTADSASFHSLNVIRDELVATIEQAARDLELFVSEEGDSRSFQSCLAGIKQINGILRLLEFKGASMLAEELLLTASTLDKTGRGPLFEKQLELVSTTFFVLSRYLEYVQQTERKIPVLLIPYINDLRKFRREPVLPESFFFPVDIKSSPPVPATDAIEVKDKDFMSLLVRLRHMYQLGLLGVLRGRQVKASLGLMRRSLIRLQRLGHDKPLSALWWMSNIALDAMIQQQMELIEPRKMLLSRIDRIIRQVQKGGRASYQAAPPKGLIKELLYLILLSGMQNETVTRLKQFFGVRQLPYTDKILASERQALRGPSAHTISSLVRVLKLEINNIKKVLETASQGGQKIDDVDGMVGTLTKIAETLGMVGLVGPSSILKNEIRRVEHWKSIPAIEEDDLNHAAKVMLYLESAVNAMEFDKLSGEALANTSEESQDQVIASGELAQAERIVLQECEAGISLTKRAITAYSESNFDSGHISNIVRTLNSVKGGLLMLRRVRGAQVVERCADFVEQVLMQGEHPPALKELLETFADAIISVEYFLDTGYVASRLDDSVLQVAEESLAALGFPVRKT
jgi:hypothetical protein